MSIKNINDSFIINAFNSENISLNNNELGFEITKRAISDRFPSLIESERNSIVEIMQSIANTPDKENCSLTVTAPNSFKLKNETTYSQIEKLINQATKQITITGYSVSNYFDDFIDKLISKSQKGVLVRLYLNEFENTILESKLKIYIGKFLRVYTFNQDDDKMAALHAKIITIDGYKSLVSSANLSYHGLEKNIEIGCVIESQKVANDINKLLEQLYFQKVFKEFKNNK